MDHTPVGAPVDSVQAAESVAAAVLSGVRALRDAPLFTLQHRELLAVGQLLERIARSVYAAQVRWAGEVDDTDLAGQLSISSTRVLLRTTLRITAGDAAARVRAARLTRQHDPIGGGHTPARLPALGAALDAGQVGDGHVGVITQAVQALPPDLDPGLVGSAERLLVDTARDADPAAVALAARHLAAILDQDGPEPDDREPACRMELRLGRRNPRTGLTPLTGCLDDETVEAFRQATDPLTTPTPTPAPGAPGAPGDGDGDGGTDPRPPALRLAQAHAAVLRGYLDAGAGPTVGGHVPHITMTIHYDPLTQAISAAGLDYAGPIPAGTARRLACDAAILPIVLGGHSQLLDVGRAHRLFTPTQRRALSQRDKGCAWPGCDRPPGRTQAHHIVSWLDGGPTDLDNGVLLCLYHHQQAHRSEWRIRLGPDRRPDFLPPTWIDPRQQPRRNHTHRPLRT